MAYLLTQFFAVYNGNASRLLNIAASLQFR
jgi:hypothetical protein